RLGCGEADLALIVGSLPLEQFEENSREQLEKIPAVVIAPRDDVEPWPVEPGVRCFAATPGLDDSGTVMRVDGVSLPLRPVRTSPNMTEREWLEAIVKQMTSFRNV